MGSESDEQYVFNQQPLYAVKNEHLSEYRERASTVFAVARNAYIRAFFAKELVARLVEERPVNDEIESTFLAAALNSFRRHAVLGMSKVLIDGASGGDAGYQCARILKNKLCTEFLPPQQEDIFRGLMGQENFTDRANRIEEGIKEARDKSAAHHSDEINEGKLDLETEAPDVHELWEYAQILDDLVNLLLLGQDETLHAEVYENGTEGTDFDVAVAAVAEWHDSGGHIV